MVNYEFKDLFNQDSIEKQITISYENTIITNEDLFNQEMTLEESLCSESQLKFGSCESSMVKFKVANIFSPMIGKTLDIHVTLEGNTKNPFRYGFYKVQSDKLTADREWREIVAYDSMYEIINSDVSDWYSTILPNDDSKMTMRQFRKKFTEHYGLQESDISLVNDDMVVEKTISIQSDGEGSENASIITESGGLSGLKVMSAICEINGCFGHIGRDGKFHYIYLPQAIEGLYPANNLFPDHAPDYLPWQQQTGHLYPQDAKSINVGEGGTYISCHYEDYLCKTIDKLQIRQEENDIGVIVGRDGDNCYIIEDNFLVYGKGSAELQKIANNIFNKITDVVYRPFNADCKGNPCLEVGDPVRISTKYDIVESYILKRTLKGIQALRDDYSAGGVEVYSEKVNSVHKSIVQLKGKSNVLERTIEETKSTLNDTEKGLQTQITQNAESITAEAIRATSEEETLSGRIQITANDITAEVTRAHGAEETLSSRIQITANDITVEVTRATDAENILSSRIQVTASSISSKVSKGDVVSEVNQSAEAIELSAGRLVITSGNFTLDSAGNVSMTGNVNATSGSIGPFSITSNGLEWTGYEDGTKIWSDTVRTRFLLTSNSGEALNIGTDGEPVRIGPYNFVDIVPVGGVFIGGNMHLEYGKYLMSKQTPLIGWSTYNNLHVGDYNRNDLPKSLILNSKKVQVVNASGSLVNIVDNTSDEREKNILSQIEQEKAVKFIRNLVPIVYQYKAENNPVTHWGFGAQTTLAAMMDSGMEESRLIARNPYTLDAPVNPEDETTFFYSMKVDELAAPYVAVLQYILNELETIKTR